MKDRNGRVLVEKGEKMNTWREHFEELLNVQSERNASISGWEKKRI